MQRQQKEHQKKIICCLAFNEMKYMELVQFVEIASSFNFPPHVLSFDRNFWSKDRLDGINNSCSF